MQDHIIAQSSHVFGYCSMYKIPNIRKIYKKKIQQIISSSHIRCSWSSMIWNIVTWVLLLFAWYLILRPFHLCLINTDALCLTHMGMGTHVICGARARPYHRQLRSCACFCIIRYERERERETLILPAKMLSARKEPRLQSQKLNTSNIVTIGQCW